MVTGYMHPGYAESLMEFGTPRQLHQCGGWIVDRHIPGFPCRDAMGCYPLFLCQNWSQLHTDLKDLGDEMVSLTLVTDPFGEYGVDYLYHCFADVVVPFKKHYVVDLTSPMETFVSSHHRRHARKALQDVQVERCQNPAQFLNEWVGLYSSLIERHNIKGIQAFSRNTFAKQFQVPGLVMFQSLYQENTVGITLWYIHGEVGYYHLGAFSPLGYKIKVSHALFWFAIKYFADHSLQWLNLGAGAGIKNDARDGLSRFKRGWSTGTRTTYFCGHIFNQKRYAEIAKAKGISSDEYFPAYRKGEFR